ncbi:McrB family protein [Oceanobacillus halotolerans]|uniref:McrB family protein n=1 Tax=Oceanobacillus halotolerans TaxID=2663380 RepID=UPI0013D2D0F1|nr:AAA family ATPase [Oceanobacillus halotolerans]
MSAFDNALEPIETIIKDQKLYSSDLNINHEDLSETFDAILIKKLATTNTITHSSSANQTHIALTSREMDIFPYLHNFNYLENQDKDNSFKRRFILELPITITSNNINYLKGNSIEENDTGLECFTTTARSRRGDNSQQVEISYIEEDSNKFTDFRKQLYTGDYIIFLKYRKQLKYLVLGIKESDEQKYNLTAYKGLSVSKKVNPTHVNVTDGLSPIIKEKQSLYQNQKITKIIELLDHNPNLILYGPPGTGKTYYTNQLKDVFDYSEMITFHQSYSYEQFVEGITAKVNDSTGQLQYFVQDGIFLKLCNEAKKNPDLKYGLIIDEINRGNISKIFGELITLIEKTKRLNQHEETVVKLPYSNNSFAVPNNLYIIGTMNTSDRSIALIDIALRRRFTFFEITPDFSLLNTTNELILTAINAVQVINNKIKSSIDKEHIIGHSYFFSLLDTPEDKITNDLKHIWVYQILPLLQEYFYTNPAEITSLLGNLTIDEGQNLSFSINYDISDDQLIETLKQIATKG